MWFHPQCRKLKSAWLAATEAQLQSVKTWRLEELFATLYGTDRDRQYQSIILPKIGDSLYYELYGLVKQGVISTELAQGGPRAVWPGWTATWTWESWNGCKTEANATAMMQARNTADKRPDNHREEDVVHEEHDVVHEEHDVVHEEAKPHVSRGQGKNKQPLDKPVSFGVENKQPLDTPASFGVEHSTRSPRDARPDSQGQDPFGSQRMTRHTLLPDPVETPRRQGSFTTADEGHKYNDLFANRSRVSLAPPISQLNSQPQVVQDGRIVPPIQNEKRQQYPAQRNNRLTPQVDTQQLQADLPSDNADIQRSPSVQNGRIPPTRNEKRQQYPAQKNNRPTPPVYYQGVPPLERPRSHGLSWLQEQKGGLNAQLLDIDNLLNSTDIEPANSLSQAALKLKQQHELLLAQTHLEINQDIIDEQIFKELARL
ncbi:hypothetical protein NUW58_g8143 [Xylaria curta]|uniref:Uncharacterized protein n=1 Tax=Xylaria curta TaxID=42375 RepID=A0ACC1NB59_9PEZI|nr:hypothetical protein NUW58_g8143 [Xylaria curta]